MKKTNSHNFEEKIKKTLTKGSSLSMSHDRKALMRENLVAYADLHAVQTPAISTPQVLPYFSFLQQRRHAYAFLSFVLVFGVSVGTTYASESALPGDTLYPVKISINEPFRTALMTSPKERASWTAVLATRRLEEATTLALDNKLTSENSAYLKTMFDEHVQATLADAETLTTDGKDADAELVKTDLEARITAHTAILSAVEEHLARIESPELFASSTVAIALKKFTKDARNPHELAIEIEQGSASVSGLYKSKVSKIPSDTVMQNTENTTPVPENALSTGVAGGVSAGVAPVATPENTDRVESSETARKRAVRTEVQAILQRNQALLLSLEDSTATTSTSTLMDMSSSTTGEASVATSSAIFTEPR